MASVGDVCPNLKIETNQNQSKQDQDFSLETPVAPLALLQQIASLESTSIYVKQYEFL